MTSLLAAFVIGIAYELFGTVWVLAAGSGRPLLCGLGASACGTTALLGLRMAVTDLSNAPGLILGYGVGAYLGASIRTQKKKS